MNYLKIEHSDVCNGTGLRCSIWLSGCSHRCPNCFNQESWNPDNGILFDEVAKQEIFAELSNDYISGITITGGDPLYESNLDDVLSLVKELRISFPEKSIWLYTGYTWEELAQYNNYNSVIPLSSYLRKDIYELYNKRLEIIKNIDILVDGEYIDEQRNLSKKWAGSDNQRVINVKQSIAQGKAILYCD